MIFYTKLGSQNFIADETSDPEMISEFNYEDYPLVRKKYFNDKSNALGIRSLIYFVDTKYDEDEFWDKYKLNKDILNQVLRIQRNFSCDREDYFFIPEHILSEFGKEYLKLIRYLHLEYEHYFDKVDLNALRYFDRARIALKRLSRNNPLIIRSHNLDQYKNHIYKIGRFDFLRVNYSNEKATNGLITSFDRSISNIGAEDDIRKCFVSRFGPKGSFWSLDYNAFHPRIIFSLSGYDVLYKNDFYQSLKEEALPNLGRDDIKIEIFKIFYGGNSDVELSKIYPNISTLIKNVQDEYFKLKYVKSPSGRRRYFEPNEQGVDRKIFNSYIQMTHSDIMSEMISKLDQFLIDKKSKLIGIIADNFLIDAHESEYDLLNEFCSIHLQKSDYLKNCFLKLNFKQGKSWATISEQLVEKPIID